MTRRTKIVITGLIVVTGIVLMTDYRSYLFRFLPYLFLLLCPLLHFFHLGHGGHGGDIYLIPDKNQNTLNKYAHIKQIKADDGEPGTERKRHGKAAADTLFKLPYGTSVFEIDPKTDKEYFLYDVTDAPILLVHGGRGGWGNTHFVSPVNQAPDFAVPGTPGEEKLIKLNLKFIADVGLIGLPNAGKSTLLAAISNASPKIGDYAFTTIEPNLGFVEGKTKSFVVADLPGLIEGASKGRGLGIKFLKHIEKTKILVHLIDPTVENIDQSYKTIKTELKSYSPDLAKKKELIVFSKSDLQTNVKSKLKPDLPISAKTRDGLSELLQKIEDNL